jgi:mevalonate pyrophosphate decarboxylase
MNIKEFYKKRIKEIEIDISDAESKKDFKQVAKLQVEKAKLEKRLNEI